MKDMQVRREVGTPVLVKKLRMFVGVMFRTHADQTGPTYVRDVKYYRETGENVRSCMQQNE